VARRKILKAQDRQELFDIPADEDSLIRHYSLSAADRLEIGLRRREHNKLGFAVQLCVMRHPGRVLAAGEIPPRAMLKYVADQTRGRASRYHRGFAPKSRSPARRSAFLAVDGTW
jgi:TnpA family transposase